MTIDQVAAVIDEAQAGWRRELEVQLRAQGASRHEIIHRLDELDDVHDELKHKVLRDLALILEAANATRH